MDGNRTHQKPRKRPLNGFEGRGTENVSTDEDTTYGAAHQRLTDLLTEIQRESPDLVTIVSAWPELPEAVRAGIVAMVKTTQGQAARITGEPSGCAGQGGCEDGQDKV